MSALNRIEVRWAPQNAFYYLLLPFREEGWYERLGGDDNPLADAIMDRIAYNSYKINIESKDPSKDISMREVYGLDPSESK